MTAIPLSWSARTECDDKALVGRIVRFYRSTFAESHYGGMWKDHFLRRHHREHRVFMSGSTEECAELLRNPATTDMQYGFELTTLTHTPSLKASEPAALGLYGVYRAWLINLADAIGAVKLPPEHPDTERPGNVELVRAVKSVIGDFTFPTPYPDEIGIETAQGIASGRAIQAIYQAWRISKLVPRSARVVEIGAGLGRTAYNAYRFGIRDYTIVDLPFSCLSSSYFLGRTLGDGEVSFPGEPRRGMRFLPPDAFLSGEEKYDLAVNVDSLTEFPRKTADRYAKAIRRQSAMFLSINHEDNAFKVGDLMGEGMRHLYPFRRGYAEELFIFKGAIPEALQNHSR